MGDFLDSKEPTKEGKTTAKTREQRELQEKIASTARVYTRTKKETAPESRLTYKRPGQKITPPSAYGSGTHRQRSWQEVREQPRRVSTCGSWRSPPDIRPGDRKEPRAPPVIVTGAELTTLRAVRLLEIIDHADALLRIPRYDKFFEISIAKPPKTRTNEPGQKTTA